jgi:hypothetical protein
MVSYSANKDGLDLSSLFSPQLAGQSQPWAATHMGLQYSGESIVVSRWNDPLVQYLLDTVEAETPILLQDTLFNVQQILGQGRRSDGG